MGSGKLANIRVPFRERWEGLRERVVSLWEQIEANPGKLRREYVGLLRRGLRASASDREWFSRQFVEWNLVSPSLRNLILEYHGTEDPQRREAIPGEVIDAMVEGPYSRSNHMTAYIFLSGDVGSTGNTQVLKARLEQKYPGSNVGIHQQYFWLHHKGELQETLGE